MPSLPPYGCGACGALFDTYDAFDAHRTTIHGRRADGTLATDPQPKITLTYNALQPLEQRIAALERRIEVLCAVIERMKGSGQP